MSMHDGWSRRRFIRTGAAAGAMGAAGCSQQQVAMVSPDKAPKVEKTKAASGKKKGIDADRIRCGFIGVGGRGRSLLGSMLDIGNVDVIALCDLKKEHAEQAAKMVEEKHKSRQGYKAPDPVVGGPTEYRKLLDRKDIHCIVSATPCNVHFGVYLDTLNAGKHLYGEKPMVIEKKHCDALVQAEARSPAIFQVGFQRRCNDRYIEAIKLVHSGELGGLIDARSVWSNAWGPLLGWFGRTAESGDWMLEQACHSWDVFNWAANGIAQWAFGCGRNDFWRDRQADRDVHDYYVATIGWAGGMVLDFVHSWIVPHGAGFPGVYEKICGIKAGVDFGSATFAYREMKDGKAVTKTVGKVVNDTHEALKTFFQCAKEGKQPPSGVHNGRDAVLVGLLVRKAVNEKRLVTMDEIVKGA
ncbi:MAG: Gfo/Idh/MocA family oxidoreductase [Phycisphaerae bacterium]|nr:Gfo/Idh/MocA family oxidoreductase [Phycisphaerae bacterium]